METSDLGAEIQEWFQSSGRLQEFQTKLRKELIDAIHKKKPSETAVTTPESEFDLALNSLILEHIMLSGRWYTASVFSSEAGFFQPMKLGSIVHLGSGGSSQAPQKFSDDSLTKIFHVLGVSGDNEHLRTLYYRSQNTSFLSVLMKALTSEPAASSSSQVNSHQVEELCLQMQNYMKQQTCPASNTELKVIAQCLEHLSTAIDRNPTASYRSASATSRESRYRPTNDLSTTSDDIPTRDESPRVSSTEAKTMKKLKEAREEIELLKKSVAEEKAKHLDHESLRAVVRDQKEELERMKVELARLKENSPRERFMEEAADSDAISRFIVETRSKLQTLQQDSVDIDHEYATLKP